MNRACRFAAQLAAAALLALALGVAACGGRASGPAGPAAPPAGTAAVTLGLAVAPVAAAAPGPPPAQAPAAQPYSAALQAGDLLEVQLQAGDAAELYQLACRIAYNPAALRFVEARPGPLLTGAPLFFVSERAEGYVPLAFTYQRAEGRSGIAAGSGELAVLHFAVLDPAADFKLSVLDDAEFLIARDAQRRSLPVRLEARR